MDNFVDSAKDGRWQWQPTLYDILHRPEGATYTTQVKVYSLQQEICQNISNELALIFIVYITNYLYVNSRSADVKLRAEKVQETLWQAGCAHPPTAHAARDVSHGTHPPRDMTNHQRLVSFIYKIGISLSFLNLLWKQKLCSFKKLTFAGITSHVGNR